MSHLGKLWLVFAAGILACGTVAGQEPPTAQVVGTALRNWIDTKADGALTQPDQAALDQVDWKKGSFTYSPNQPQQIVWEVRLKTEGALKEGSPEAAKALEVLQKLFDQMADDQLKQDAYFAAGTNLQAVKGNTGRVKLVGLGATGNGDDDSGGADEEDDQPRTEVVVCCDCYRRCGLLRRLFGGCCGGCGTVICVPSCEAIVKQCQEDLEPMPCEPVVEPVAARSATRTSAPAVVKAAAPPVRSNSPYHVAAAPAVSEPITAARIARHFAPATPTDTLLVSTGSASPAGVSAPRLPPPIAAEFYSRVYHAYWSRDYVQAWKDAVEGLELGDDARLWYYKGFAETQLGRDDDACLSLARAVQCHATTANEAPVRKSLERIQGRLRLELQSALAVARRAARPTSENKDLVAVSDRE